jgi:putative SOS response-associated peptidase YedK
MCLNFIPTQNHQWIKQKFSVSLPNKFQEEIYPGYYCPIIRGDFDSGQYICDLAHFGLIPSWAKSIKIDRHTFNVNSESMTANHRPNLHHETYNAKSETVNSKPSFRVAWNRKHFAIVVIDSFMQPNYETGSAVRWKIHKQDNSPFALACLWERWSDVDIGEDIISFSILTRDASAHPLLHRFHKLGDAKRMPIIIPDAYLHTWLEAGINKANEIIALDPPLDLIAEPFPKKTSNLKSK